MEFHFRSHATVRASNDPLLATILEDCEIRAEVTIYCRTHGDEMDFMALDVGGIAYEPPDSHGAVKARALDCPELKDSIHIALEDSVEREWDDYYHQAREEVEAMREAAAEERWERRGR